MNLKIQIQNLPGSTVLRSSAAGITGEEFLDKIFFLSDGIMLSLIKEISGVDGTTLQNWVKRGWIGNTVNKKYSKNQLARILIINMMRSTVQLEKIDQLLKYVNGNINCEDDDIIPESRLYGYICTIIDKLDLDGTTDISGLKSLIHSTVSEYKEPFAGARIRLENALSVIITAYFASLVKDVTTELFSGCTE